MIQSAQYLLEKYFELETSFFAKYKFHCTHISWIRWLKTKLFICSKTIIFNKEPNGWSDDSDSLVYENYELTCWVNFLLWLNSYLTMRNYAYHYIVYMYAYCHYCFICKQFLINHLANVKYLHFHFVCFKTRHYYNSISIEKFKCKLLEALTPIVSL